MKNLNCLKPEKLDPINLFVTGGAEAGKSHLIKAIYHTAVKTFRYGTINPERPTVALMAPLVLQLSILMVLQYIQPYQFPKNLEILHPKCLTKKDTVEISPI